MPIGIAFVRYPLTEENTELVGLFEKMGIEYLWVADNVPRQPFRDPYITLAAAALKTETIKLGVGISNPYARHPAIMAAAILSVDELSEGRACMGIGPGGSFPLVPLGIKLWDRPLKAVRECVKVLRRLFGGETVNFEGDFFKLRSVKMFRESKMPIYVAAKGPKMMKLAGEVADGVLLQSPVKLLHKNIRRVLDGAIEAGRDPSKIDIANVLPYSIAKDREKAREFVKAALVNVVADSPASVVEELGIPVEERRDLRKAIRKEGFLAAKDYVTNAMIDNFAVAGGAETCIEMLHKMIREGVNQPVIRSPVGPDIKEAVNMIGKEIIPSL